MGLYPFAEDPTSQQGKKLNEFNRSVIKLSHIVDNITLCLKFVYLAEMFFFFCFCFFFLDLLL